MKKTYKLFRLFAVLIAVILHTVLFAQADRLGGWHIANLNYHATKNISLYAEVQTRSQKLTTDFYYRELKGGIAYNFPKKNSIFFGFGDYRTYTYPGNFKSPLAAKEFRVWEQFVLNNNIDRVKIEHRYRIEQRWVNGTYRDRFRYRLNPVIPLSHPAITTNTLYATVFDEVFFTSKPPYFERNRVFAGLGYQFTKSFAFQLGFIRQYDYRVADNGSGKNFFQTSFLFNADHTTAHRESHPSTMD